MKSKLAEDHGEEYTQKLFTEDEAFQSDEDLKVQERDKFGRII